MAVNSETSPNAIHNDNNTNTNTAPQQQRGHTNKLNIIQLAILVFYNVSGGPFGIEPSLRAGGNLFTILGFMFLPFVWSIPEALVTAELGSAFQSSSGGVIWVQTAFGDMAGAFSGYFNWIAGATDNAIYPVLFLAYLTGSDGAGEDGDGEGLHLQGIERFLYVSGLSIALAWLNYLGLEIVGNASILIAIISMSPFIVMMVMGAAKVNTQHWLQLPDDSGLEASDLFDDDFESSPGLFPLVSFGIVLRPFLNNMFWNLNSFDSAASFAEEVMDVKTTYPRGIFLGVGLCYIFNLIPILIMTGATNYEQKDWFDGHLANVGADICGEWMRKWFVFAIGISNLALFEAEMSADAYQLMGMAEQGYLPRIFKMRSKYGTPKAGIVTGTLVIVMMSVADFSTLIEILNANYAISLLMEYAAFVKLRFYRDDLHRPYRVPVSNWASIILILPPSLGILVLLAISSWMTYVFVCCVFLFCSGLIAMQHVLHKGGWCEFDAGKNNGIEKGTTRIVDENLQLVPSQNRQDYREIL